MPIFCSRQAKNATGALCPKKRVKIEMAFCLGLDETQCLQVESWFAEEMVQILRIAHAAVLSGCQSWSSDGVSLHLTRGQVLAKRRDISSGRFSPVNSRERRWAGRRKESPSTQQRLNPRQC